MDPSREARLRTLAHEFSPAIANYLRRRAYPLTESDVEDMVEEVLLVTWRRLDDVTEGFELPWMIGVASNVLNNARRKHSRRRRMQSKLRPQPDASSAEDVVVANDQLRRALNRLTPSEREVLLLRYWDGFDVPAIATILSISPGAAAVRLSRSAERLREGFHDASPIDVTD
jgi:RNA polymerase sigma-70 factor (ECF subfamily)